MDDVQDPQQHSRGSQLPPISKNAATTLAAPTPPPASKFRHWRWWLTVVLLSFLVLTGQTAATLLGRFYYDQGGNSKWMATLVQSAGSPLLLPLLFFFRPCYSPTTTNSSISKISFIYISLGLIIACDNLMYSYGLLYLQVSTYSLICATQLAFSAVFSYFMNSQKFTALIFNSVILLTFSAALLGVRASSETSIDVSRGKYAFGFIITTAASATFSLILSLMQLTFEKVTKTINFRVVLEMQVCTNFTATCASVAGLFASGEWRSLKGEMEGFGKGKVAYVMTLAGIAISWQVAAVGLVGLIFVVSSLFSNMIGTLGLPLVPIFAVILLHDKMDGVKSIALLLALWGFLSYIYQHYIDDRKAKKMLKGAAMETSVV